MSDETVTTRTSLELILNVKKAYPEVEGLTATGVIDWALRKIVQVKESKQSSEVT